MVRRFRRTKRRRFFVACEGQSESGYASLINKFADEAGLSVYFDIQNCRGGDPLVIVNRAITNLHQRRKLRGGFEGHVILLDADRRDESTEKSRQADRLLEQHEFHAIWSYPNFEATLLLHMPDSGNLTPSTSTQSIRELKKHWPDYGKGMAASDLRTNIDRDGVERAAQNLPELKAFLVDIGLIRTK